MILFKFAVARVQRAVAAHVDPLAEWLADFALTR